MKRIFIGIFMLFAAFSMQAQNLAEIQQQAPLVLKAQGGFYGEGKIENAKNEMSMNIQEIADRIALKDLVDTFSNLADTKEIDKQVQLFTEEAEVTSYQGDKQTLHLKGRKELAERFRAFLDQFTTVYHINGQQTVKIDGDKATGIAYAQVVLVSEKNGKRTMLTQGVRYSDEYERQDGKWLISKRISHFEWSKEQ